MYDVSAAKHAGQERIGEVYQVSRAQGRSDHSAVEVGPESQHYVQAGLVGRRLGKSKVSARPCNLSGFILRADLRSDLFLLPRCMCVGIEGNAANRFVSLFLNLFRVHLFPSALEEEGSELVQPGKKDKPCTLWKLLSLRESSL